MCAIAYVLNHKEKNLSMGVPFSLLLIRWVYMSPFFTIVKNGDIYWFCQKGKR
jgi:hypothetical protein